MFRFKSLFHFSAVWRGVIAILLISAGCKNEKATDKDNI